MCAWPRGDLAWAWLLSGSVAFGALAVPAGARADDAALAAVAATHQVLAASAAPHAQGPGATWLAWSDTELLTLQALPLRVTQRQPLRSPPRAPPLIDAAAALVLDADGVLTRWNLEPLARQAQVSARLSSVALAAGRGEVLGARDDPPALVWFDAALRPVKWIPVTDDKRKQAAPVSALRTAPARNSFVAVVPALAQLWELSYDPAAPDIAAGFIHDFRYREGAFVRGYRNAQRIVLEQSAQAVHLPCDAHEVLVLGADGGVSVTHLDVRRRIASLSGLPATSRLALDQAVSWGSGAQRRMAAPVHGQAMLALIDVDPARVVKLIPTLAPIAGLARQPDSERLWLRFDAGAHAGTLQVVDGAGRARTASLRVGDQALQGLSFAPGGLSALAILADAIVVLDALTLREVERLALPGLQGAVLARDATLACHSVAR